MVKLLRSFILLVVLVSCVLNTYGFDEGFPSDDVDVGIFDILTEMSLEDDALGIPGSKAYERVGLDGQVNIGENGDEDVEDLDDDESYETDEETDEDIDQGDENETDTEDGEGADKSYGPPPAGVTELHSTEEIEKFIKVIFLSSCAKKSVITACKFYVFVNLLVLHCICLFYLRF